jgi:uncharacterized membrane protein YesL
MRFIVGLILFGVFGACVAIGAVITHWERKP